MRGGKILEKEGRTENRGGEQKTEERKGRQQRKRRSSTAAAIFLPLLQHCEEEGKQQHWLAKQLCRDSTISVPPSRR
jgi:hypothetical protein